MEVPALTPTPVCSALGMGREHATLSIRKLLALHDRIIRNWAHSEQFQYQNSTAYPITCTQVFLVMTNRPYDGIGMEVNEEVARGCFLPAACCTQSVAHTLVAHLLLSFCHYVQARRLKEVRECWSSSTPPTFSSWQWAATQDRSLSGSCTLPTTLSAIVSPPDLRHSHDAWLKCTHTSLTDRVTAQLME